MAIGVYFVSLFVVEICLYLFHLSVLILLFVKRKTTFNGSFYDMFRIVIIAEIGNFLCICFSQRLTQVPSLIPFFKTNEFIASAGFVAYSYAIVTIFLGHTLMALNRFTLIWFPLKYHKIWERKWYIFVILFLPLLNNCWRFHEPGLLIYLSDTVVVPIYKNPIINELFGISLGLIFLSCQFFGGILNILSFIRFRFYKSTVINVKEKHLLFVSFITFGGQSIQWIFSLQQVFFPKNLDLTALFLTLMPIFNDIFALSGTISFIILSKITRKEYIKFYFRKNSSDIPSTISSHPYMFQRRKSTLPTHHLFTTTHH